MIKWVVVGRSASGLIVERYFLRSWRTVCQVKDELLLDLAIRSISVISLCQLCGGECRNGRCQTLSCENSRRAPLSESVQEASLKHARERC